MPSDTTSPSVQAQPPRAVHRFPAIADQVRCSTGYTHAPGGRLQALSTQLVARPRPRPEPVACTPHGRPRHLPSGLAAVLLEMLQLIGQTEDLPNEPALAVRSRGRLTAYQVRLAMVALVDEGHVRRRRNPAGTKLPWTVLKLTGCGTVLRSARAPVAAVVR